MIKFSYEKTSAHKDGVFMKKETEKLLFNLGCTSLTLGVLCITILPLAFRYLDVVVLPVASSYKFASFALYSIGAAFYAFSFQYYNDQLKWIIKLVVFYLIFAILVRSYLHFGLLDFSVIF